jgi:hypothetical protein
MIDPSQFERFSGNNFLLERGRATLRYLTQSWQQRLTSFLVRFLLFGGFLGLMWTLSHVAPQGDLSLYLIPITLLALPIGLIAPQEKTWEKGLNLLFLGAFSSFLIWSGIWYFQYYKWGYQFKWLFLEACLLLLLGFLSWHKNTKHHSEPQYSLLTNLWLVGICVIFASLGFLAYYLINQVSPEASTATILSGGTFVLFLALTIIRVFWLDSIRYRRASRSEHIAPQDHILLLEWLIPRSYSFVVTLALLLISEAMMFSTIYRSTQVKMGVIPNTAYKVSLDLPKSIPYQIKEHQSNLSAPYSLPKNVTGHTRRPPIPLQHHQSHDLSISKTPSNTVHEVTQTTSSVQQTHMQEIALREWIFFSFKPYVFPKDYAGREAEAPRWFKYLGRALLGLIFAILLTKQLNIWKLLGALYFTLLGAARRIKLRGNDQSLLHQQNEMIANLNAMFNTHAPFWRWQLFYSVTAPTLSLKWRILLDPSSAFYMGLDRLLLWVVARWDMALFAVGILIFASTAPFAYLDPQLVPHFYDATIPAVSSCIFIGFLRLIIGLKPPKSYQFWIWWILLIHVLTALLCFFLSINIGTREAFWPSILWYLQICSVGVFPALYLFGGERHRKVSNIMHRQDVSIDDCDYKIRINLLQAFVRTEHRQWLAQEITRLIHPVRSGSLQLRLLIPSLLIGVLDTLRVILERSNQFFRWITAYYSRALLIWMSIQVLVWLTSFLTHLFTFHRLLPEQIVVAYLLNLSCLLIPTLTPLIFAQFKGFKIDLHRLNSVDKRRYLLGLNLLSSIGALMLWIQGYNTSPVWQETTRYSWFTFVFIPPWLPMWTFFQSFISQRKSRHLLNHLGIFERLAQWLSTKESQYLASIYERVNRARHLPQDLRQELIESCATLIESTYDALRQGRWYEEERHAIRRVYRQWVSGLERIEEEEEIAEELAYLQEQVLDTLGSLLYDLSATGRFDQQRIQDIDSILTSLIRILHLPNPNTINHHHSSAQELQSCYESLYDLCTWLIHQLIAHQEDQRSQATSHSPSTTPELIATTQEVDHFDGSNLASSLFELNTDMNDDKVTSSVVTTTTDLYKDSLDTDSSLITQENLLKTSDPMEREVNSVVDPAIENLNIESLDIAREVLEMSSETPENMNSESLEISSKKTITLTVDNIVSPQSTPTQSIKRQSLNISIDENPHILSLLFQLSSLLQRRLQHEQLDLHLDLYPNLDPQIIIQAASLHPEGSCYLVPYLPVDFPNVKAPKSDKHRDLHDEISHEITTHALSTYLQLNLPTPIAISEHNLMQSRYAYITQYNDPATLDINDINTIQVDDDILSRLQSPQALVQLRFQLQQEQSLDQATQKQYMVLYHAYFSVFAYLLGILKDRESLSLEVLQDLTWSNAHDLTHSIKYLRRKRSLIQSQDLLSLIFTLFNHSNCRLIERIYQTRQNWDRGFDIWRNLTLQLLQNDESLPFLHWRPQSNLGRALFLKGLYPIRKDMEQEKHRLGRGVRLKNYDLRPLIDYYPALWLLKLLDGLAQSDGLFHPENDEVATDRLHKLSELTQRFARLLRPFAPEEQRVVIRMYQHITKRLEMLSDLNEADLSTLDGQGDLDFNLTLNKIFQYLNDLEERVLRRFNHLLKLELLPSMKFCFLAGVEACHPDELRWYYDLEDIEPSLYLCMSFLGMAEGGYPDSLDDPSSVKVLNNDSVIQELNHMNDKQEERDNELDTLSKIDLERTRIKDMQRVDELLINTADEMHTDEINTDEINTEKESMIDRVTD